MRRLTGLLTPALIALGLLLPAAPAVALPDSFRHTIVLATEAGGTEAPTEPAAGGEQAPGPEPAPPDARGNPAAPPEYEQPWIWGVSFILLASFLALLAVGGFLYWLLVVRPRQRTPV